MVKRLGIDPEFYLDDIDPGLRHRITDPKAPLGVDEMLHHPGDSLNYAPLIAPRTHTNGDGAIASSEEDASQTKAP